MANRVVHTNCNNIVSVIKSYILVHSYTEYSGVHANSTGTKLSGD